MTPHDSDADDVVDADDDEDDTKEYVAEIILPAVIREAGHVVAPGTVYPSAVIRTVDVALMSNPDSTCNTLTLPLSDGDIHMPRALFRGFVGESALTDELERRLRRTTSASVRALAMAVLWAPLLLVGIHTRDLLTAFAFAAGLNLPLLPEIEFGLHAEESQKHAANDYDADYWANLLVLLSCADLLAMPSSTKLARCSCLKSVISSVMCFPSHRHMLETQLHRRFHSWPRCCFTRSIRGHFFGTSKSSF